ncbi:AAA family ATPase [Rhodopirellula sp. JC740]|uniref:AAA family ATPase n=1 Tax=Rhodopirellula halodulae TaxID=2894198 RepID=A0ABS8NNU9_9BACT|nr:AAA family ATPase [Rhodopirellula sp. JC740]MCC9644111.1 AAA family ATPase [Rhodopirellula sp. JC740]
MAVRVDVHELLQLLEITPPDQNIMLVGKHGIGKSQIIADHFTARGMKVVPFFLGQMSDPGDLIGLLHKDEATGRSEFLPPFWWPVNDEPIVLFLDELNRARPEILQSVMELTLNKTLAGKRLPEGSVIISAVNEGDEYQLTDLDPALISRFNLYQFAPTVEDWLLWAEQHEVDDRVTSFIQQQPQFLDGEGSAPGNEDVDAMSGLVKTPDRRGWARVSSMLDGVESIGPLHIKLVAGVVGSPAAMAFRRSLASRLPVTPDQVLLQFSKHRKVIEKMSLSELLMLNEKLMMHLVSDPYEGSDRTKSLKALLSYLKLLRKRKLDEVVAHFVSMTDQSKYESTMDLFAESMELMNLLTEYVEGIQIQ